MKKIDYSLLAEIIRAEVVQGDALRADTAKRIALNFANRAHVNKSEFLAACGISTG
ncbi:hypothetical protein [Curvibacter phage PCA1]|nr:hypothetical protein [Curvibacter phage PCA1]